MCVKVLFCFFLTGWGGGGGVGMTCWGGGGRGG